MTLLRERHAQPGTHPVPYEQIDPGIRAVVRALNEAGFRTFSSCEGHDGSDPEVVLEEISWKKWIDLVDLEHVASSIQKLGLSGCYVSLILAVNASSIGAPHIAIRWWTRRPVAAWAASQEEGMYVVRGTGTDVDGRWFKWRRANRALGRTEFNSTRLEATGEYETREDGAIAWVFAPASA